MRRSVHRQSRPADAIPSPRGPHSRTTRPYDPIPADQADRIVEAALTLLSEIGLRFEPGTEADALLAAAGCRVGEGVVRMPASVVRAALASCAKSTRLWNRDGTKGIDIDRHHTWFMPGMTCIKVFDPVTGEPRDSTGDDLATIIRLADGLPNIDAVCVACKDVPNSTLAGEIGEFFCMMENTTKPLEFLGEWTASLEAAIAMAAALRGGRDRLAERPYFLHIVTPLPLSYAQGHSEQIILAARAGIPVSVGTLAIGGASTPITMAGTVLQCLATDFAGMVLGQAARRGAFCIGSTNPLFMEPATGGIGNLSQTMLAEQMICQVRRQLDLPSLTGLGGDARARRFGEDAVFEIATMMGQIYHTRPATCDYLGSLDQGITFSLHALLLCDDHAGLLRMLWAGADISDETLALDVLRETGLTGSVLGHAHTARHCRTGHWASRYFAGNEPLSTTDLPDETLFQRIDRDLRARLAAPGPDPLPPELAAQLRAIQLRFARTGDAA
ncbi:trimethylamine methyltransferase family protein [Rhodobacter sp. Har01]|uniref:trimethylamine methyltransferase family protein n=1 Tax=Rhodobacter sp. Har01 TaxID=2883999 RepID=UPI001D060600|nr:trimethylamine methyltransferase family protein [Rhodobacter sp. Har01]MCB6180175.1 trimethylamine methyltransferase family protein [Rhodobacter sp. Har01]